MKLFKLSLFTSFASLVLSQVTFQDSSQTILRVDNGTYGPPLEEVHYYYDQWPIGLAVSSNSRIFTCYTRGNYTYTLGEVVNKTAERPYPNAQLNLPPNQINQTLGGIPFGSSNSEAFISVQALFITPETGSRPETLWVLDTGRPTITASDGSIYMPYGAPGGPKLVAINIANDTIYKTYTFEPDVHYPDSYMNDLRFDFQHQVAYIVDSSDENRNGFIILNLTTGAAHRRLTQHPSTLRTPDAVPQYQSKILNFLQPGPQGMLMHLPEGLDGLTLSADGETAYYSPLPSDYLYSIPTSALRNNTPPLAEQAAWNAVSNLGQRGGMANGFESDSNNMIYMLMPESNSIGMYDPSTLQFGVFVRDPRILWPDSAALASDGYMYVNINQLPYQPNWNGGVDGRMKPGAILRAKVPNGGTKIGGFG
ncbi:MAG: hypothetical protein Q9227_006939 [Pyrenula ochraceoflavens]